VFVGVVGTAITRQAVIGRQLLPNDVMPVDLVGKRAGLEPSAAGAPMGRIRHVEGVRDVIALRAPSARPEYDESGSRRSLIAASDWRALGTGQAAPAGAAVVVVDQYALFWGSAKVRAARPRELPAGGLDTLPVSGLLVTTDGSTAATERLRTAIERALPSVHAPITIAEMDEENWGMLAMLQRMVDVGIILSLVIAGCSLAVSVAGGLIERRRPFSLLRLTGMPLAHLRRVVLLEAAVPLTLVAVLSIAAGLLASDLILRAAGGTDATLALPGAGFWAIVVGGLAGALAIVVGTMPLLARVTEPQSARME
jgi:hypothetical protein